MNLLNLFGSPKRQLHASEMFIEYPMGIRYILLLHFEDKGSPNGFSKAASYYREASRLEKIIVERNMRGIELEKDNCVKQAIRIYEQSVADCVDTPHPYERLRIIYSKRKQYDDAIRVCKAYVFASTRLSDAIVKELGNPTLATQLGSPLKFPDWIVKLEQKRNGVVQSHTP